MNFENIKIKAGYIGNILQKDNLFSLMTEWLIILICFGYPLQAMFVFLLKTDSTPVNIAIRAVYLLISISLIFSTLWPNIKKVHWTFFIFIMFWILYGIRLVYDIQVKHLYYAWNNGYYVYAYAFGASLLPAAAVFLNNWRIKSSRLFQNSFYVLIIANLSITINLLTTTEGGISTIFGSRASFIMHFDERTVQLINPISVSFFGAILVLFSLWMIYNWTRKIKSPIFLIIYSFTLILGLFNMFAGASKGPFLSFAIVFIVMTGFKIYFASRFDGKAGVSRMGSQDRIEHLRSIIKRLFPLLIIIAIVILLIIISYGKLKTTTLGVRLADYHNSDPESSFAIRLIMWKNAWTQFLNHPFLGDRYLETYLNSYPHNVILESLMATGLFGGLLFIVFLFQPFYLYSRLTRSQKLQFFPAMMFFLFFFLMAMVSGGLFSSPDLWLMTATSIALFHRKYKYPGGTVTSGHDRVNKLSNCS